MKTIVNLSVLSAISLGLLVTVGFQNCAPNSLSDQNNIAANAKKRSTSPAPAPAPTTSAVPTFQFTINDPNNFLGSKRDLLLQNAEAAAKLWSGHFNSAASLQVRIDVYHTYNNMFGGTSKDKKYIGTFNGLNVAEEGASHELRTGNDINGAEPDILLSVDPDYLNNEMWLDPYPYQRTAAVPYNREDGVSVFLHELGHALGFNGYFPDKNVPMPAGWIGVYDKFISIDASGKAWFNGPNSVALYDNKPIPLNTAMNYHMGNIETAATDGFGYFLMTGNYFMYGYRYNIDNRVVAVLKDLDLPAK